MLSGSEACSEDKIAHDKDNSTLVNWNGLKLLILWPSGKGKGKVHPRTGHEVPEGELRYSSTLSLTSALVGGWAVNATPWPLYPHEKDLVPIV
jgi:hypothetical protein